MSLLAGLILLTRVTPRQQLLARVELVTKPSPHRTKSKHHPKKHYHYIASIKSNNKQLLVLLLSTARSMNLVKNVRGLAQSSTLNAILFD